MGKRYFILQVPLPIDFLLIVWPLSQGWDSSKADPIQGSVGTVQGSLWEGGVKDSCC